jgi:nucleoid-associated protein YgaU
MVAGGLWLLHRCNRLREQHKRTVLAQGRIVNRSGTPDDRVGDQAMRLGSSVVFLVLVALVGCAAPEVRFSRTECLPVVGDDHVEAVRFISDFQANGAVPEQQLVFQVAVVDAAGRPIPSRTGKYKDLSGNLMAAKGVMVLQSPWVFENIDVAIPAPELNAAREDGAAFADFQLASPDGQILTRARVRLPTEFAAAAPSRATQVARRSGGRAGEDETGTAAEPETASAAGERARREDPRNEKRAPAARQPVPQTDSAAPPSSTRRGGTGRPSETIVRESRPEPGARTGEAESPPTVARGTERPSTSGTARPAKDKPSDEARSAARPQRDADRGNAARPPVRETEIERAQARDAERRSTETAEESEKPATNDPGGQTETSYTVKAADSLRSISLEHYGDAQFWPMILRANPDVNPLKLRAGDKLVLPALDAAGNAKTTAPRSAEKGGGGRSEPSVYVTKDGDTLPFIAKQLYGDSRRWREIYDLNRDQLETPSAVKAGQRLKLPQGAKVNDESKPAARP